MLGQGADMRSLRNCLMFDKAVLQLGYTNSKFRLGGAKVGLSAARHLSIYVVQISVVLYRP